MRIRGNIKKLINKSREAALLSVAIYNNPQTVFKSYAYIVNICIAWTALFHAIFEKNQIKYFYKMNTAKLQYIRIDGEYKAWDLSKCITEYYKEVMNPARANLEFIVKLRNKIEHRFLPELDSHVFGECQSCLFNYEKMLVKEFGNEYAINNTLAFSLQFSEVYNGKQKESMKNLKRSELDKLREHLDEFRQMYTDDILESMEYSFRVFLIPQTGNNIKSSDKAITFIKESDLSKEEYEMLKKDITLIKNKRVPVSNADMLRVSEVVERVQLQVDFKFTINKHTTCWKYYKVRPSGTSSTPEVTDTTYCIYDGPHKDYLYTEAWVEKLVKDLSDENIRNIIFSSKKE